jgi:4-hydroxy-tetrahydrodipicolinate reductase
VKKIGVQGLTGKTGRYILSVFGDLKKDFQLVAIVRNKNSNGLFLDTGESIEQYTVEELQIKKISLDVILDFTTPSATIPLAEYCKSTKTPLLVATTGFTPEQIKILGDFANGHFPLLRAPNTSIGVLALVELCKSARIMLGDSFDIEISEIHHNQKKDAPSGTAVLLADAIKKEGRTLDVVHDRGAIHAARSPESLGVTAIRGGTVVGEHTVYFIGQGERLELTHRAWDRAIFARGALSLGLVLMNKQPGFYTVNRDFLGV